MTDRTAPTAVRTPLGATAAGPTVLDRRRFLAAVAAGVTVAVAAPSSAASAATGPVTLDEFLTLSRLLTDVDDLDEEAGARYLAALRADGTHSAGLTRLVQVAVRSARPPRDFAALTATGVLREPAPAAAAQAALTSWYTGKVGDEVVTYLDALAWTTLADFAEPASECLGYAKWADRP